MKDYKQYLQKAGYADKTIAGRQHELRYFIKWCKRQHTTPEQIDYKTCLKYIKHLKRKGNTINTVNHKLGDVKSYFKYLIDTNYRADNPIENTNVRGGKREIHYYLLSPDELEDLYYSFDTKAYQERYHKYTAKRNKIIVGLLVYQGLDTQDLRCLTLEHLQLTKGKIYVPARKRSNARTLELKPWQIIELMEYVNDIRPMLLKRLQLHTDQLLPYGKRYNIMPAIVRKLKKYNQQVQNNKQIRASVITNWLQQYNLREVQYLAGHRYISSTERYLQDDLENLHEIVNNFHPIN